MSTSRTLVSLPSALWDAWKAIPASRCTGGLSGRLQAALEADLRAAGVEPPPAPPPARTAAATAARWQRPEPKSKKSARRPRRSS